MPTSQIICGTSREVLKDYPVNHFDAVVTDPPYGIKFMGKKWDYEVPTVEDWEAIYRVLKPGAHMLVACGTRTQHRMVVNIEDAGFDIRDVITWHYGSGFPKSLDVSKAIDKLMGVERSVIGQRQDILQKQGKDLEAGVRKIVESLNNGSPERNNGFTTVSADITAAATEEAKQYDGYGTALKPATEFWTLCRKPFTGSVTANILKHGVGGLNIDACRIESGERDARENNISWGISRVGEENEIRGNKAIGITTLGRFPANVIFDEFTASLLDEQTGDLKSGAMRKSYLYKNNGFSMGAPSGETNHLCGASIGGASRFFYVAKASRSERNMGLEMGTQSIVDHNASMRKKEDADWQKRNGNYHPTVKPVKLMQYLCRLITPTGGGGTRPIQRQWHNWNSLQN